MSSALSQVASVSVGTVRILYTNWRGETGWRTIVPLRLDFCSTEWHPDMQWVLQAVDVEKRAERSFAMKDIHDWQTEP
jgi:hypothetical protein